MSLKNLLTSDGWQVSAVANGASLDSYQSDSNKLICLSLLDPNIQALTLDDVELIKTFISKGNSLIIAAGERDDESRGFGVINQLAREYGVQFNRDCVIRPNPSELYHPKEALLEDFIANRGLIDVMRKFIKTPITLNQSALTRIENGSINHSPRIIYPMGCTLKVDPKVAPIMMTSSKWALPSRQAICAFYRDNETRLIAIGSTSLLNDVFIDKEDNRSLVRTLLEFIENRKFPINISDAKTIDMPDNNMTPDISRLADMPIYCLMQSEPLPADKSTLVDRQLFNIDNSKLPSVMKAYEDLSVPREPLTLIKPDLVMPSFEFEPASHGFLLRRLSERPSSKASSQ